MWVYIKKQDVDEYLNQYPELEADWLYFCLLETKDCYFVPRLFYKNYPSNLLNVHYGKYEYNIKQDQKYNFKGTPRKVQKEASDRVLNIYKQNGYVNGIIKIPPGKGKTVLSSLITAELGFKTCIVVDNTGLMKQWIEEYTTFTSLTEDDIGIIKENVCTLDQPVIIASAQTLSSKIKNNFKGFYKKLVDANIGMIIYDEVHTTSSSEIFSKISLLFKTLNVIGLSATPFHTNFQKILMTNTIGEVIYSSSDYELIPTYYMLYYKSHLDGRYSKALTQMKDYTRKKSYYNKILPKSNSYLMIIAKSIIKLYKDGHNVVAIFQSINQINSVSELLDKNGIEYRQYHGKSRELDKENDRILLTTYSFTGKGFNMKRLSALVLGLPLAGRKSLIQTIGRILREYDDKMNPVVVDLIDCSFPFFTLKESDIKKSVVSNEFENCKIIEQDVTHLCEKSDGEK